MTTSPPPPPPPLRAHPIAGAASVLLSGFLGITWLWISVSMVASGLGALAAAGAGVLVLIPWILAMRVAAAFERRRAQAVHGLAVVVPARRRSRRTGLAGWLHELWLDAISWPFWRSALHHHAVMTVGLLVASCFWMALLTACTFLLSLVTDAVAVPPHLSELAIVGIAAGLLVLALAVLAIGVLAERGLARLMLADADVTLREEVEELAQQRQGAVDAAAAERLRIERDLHDGVQPRLVALAMTLGMARSRITTEPERAEQLVAEAHEESKAIMTEVRQLARGIHPAVLTDRGLDAALSALAARAAVPVALDVQLPVRPSHESEAVAYFVVSEALTNIAKHADASHARVDLRGDGERLRLVIEDDGRGGAAVHRDGVSTGLAGLTDRVRATGGHLVIASELGHGTRLTADIPLDASRKDTAR